MRIAVVGSGVAGLGAAWALGSRHQVVLYEADRRPGGHANTVEIVDEGRTIPVDTGFIVFNRPNYPNLVRFFSHLGVATEPSDMSFSVSVGDGAFEHSSRARGVLAQPSNLLRPDTWRMWRDFRRFCREAPATLRDERRESLDAFLERGGYSDAFAVDLLLPMSAAIWSSSLEEILEFPIASLVRFLGSHAMLQVGDRPRWRTVSGGSREYVSRVMASLRDVRLGTRVVSAVRDADGVDVIDANGGRDRFDHLVLATHADVTRQILREDATGDERRVLGAFDFQRNLAVLHRDPALMPRRRAAWSSWNYLADGRGRPDREQPVSLTYWMNRLQNLQTRRPVFVTLNPTREPRGQATAFEYRHPRFDQAALDAQEALPAIQGVRRTWFAGAWSGFGFHEDGVRSGLQVADALGSPPPWAVAPSPALVGSWAR
jgi:predicted NAD/FAD-binding protein